MTITRLNINLKLNFYSIQYCTQEIVVFREDMIGKVCRNCIHIPEDEEDIPSHVTIYFKYQFTNLLPLLYNGKWLIYSS